MLWKFDWQNYEIASLRKKLEETQRTMEQIMAEVNKVSSEIKDPLDVTLVDNSSSDQHNNTTDIHAYDYQFTSVDY